MSAKVEVRVDSAGKPTASPDTLPLPKGNNVNIKWEIVDSPDWTFTGNGIDIQGNDGQFSDGHSSAQGKTWHWKDKNDNNKLYNYVINVTKAGTLASADPAIQNQA